MARRLVALAVALLLIAGALAIRNRIDDDSDSAGGSSNGGSGPVALTCATELAEACRALADADGSVIVVVEDAGKTAQRLETADTVDDVDAWLVEAPWPDIVDEARDRNGLPALFDGDPKVLARSPLVLAMWNDRLAAIVQHCDGGALTWKCIGEVAGEKWSTLDGEEAWGIVKPGFADPAVDGVGALVLGQAAVSFFGETDLSRDRFDEADFQRWIRQLASAVPQNPTFDDMLTLRQAAVDVVGTTEAEAGPGLENSRDKANITITYPAPMATADVVVASVAGAEGGERLVKIVSGDAGLDPLAAAGWRVPGRVVVAGVDTTVSLPASSGLPSPGAIDALRSLWKDLT
jgi:hypothetical protein